MRYLVARHKPGDDARIFLVGIYENDESAYETLMCMEEPLFDDMYYMVIQVVGGEWEKFYHREERSYIKHRVVKEIRK